MDFDVLSELFTKSLTTQKDSFDGVVRVAEDTKVLLLDQGLSNDDVIADISCAIQVSLRKHLLSKDIDGDVIDLAIQLALKSDFAASELPFLLFEDMFETISVHEYQTAWELVEERTQVLTCKELMPFDKMTRSKMAMLRIANFLLRRLSASHHTVLCGKVMMFLAYSFPLYERSGVNLLGAFNEDNVTQVEDEEEFLQLIQADHSNPGKNTIDYTLYSRFWELQQFFVVKAEKGCLMDLENWEKFVHVANVVLQAFESNPFSKADLDREMVNHRKRSRSRSLSSIEIDSNTPSFVPTKFLSSSRLLSLQLSDPVLRRNVLCQFMILFHTISKSPLKTVSEKAREKDKSFGVQYLVKRVAELIKHTPPDGDSFFKDMGSILESESGWKTWKSNKCPNFERYPIHEEKMDGPPSKVPKPSSNIELWSNDFADWRNSFASRAANTTPVFPDFIKDMEIAMDPENCIEEDYHPKYDDVYCWRGFRLLSRDNLEVMEKVVDGSLEHACSSRVPSYKSENADKTDIVMADGTLDEPATKVSPS